MSLGKPSFVSSVNGLAIVIDFRGGSCFSFRLEACEFIGRADYALTLPASLPESSRLVPRLSFNSVLMEAGWYITYLNY